MKYIFIVFYFLLSPIFLPAQVQVQTITTPFNGSGGLHLGPDGRLYIADFGTGLDQADGTQVSVLDYKAGEQPQTWATGLSGASGNDFDAEGNLFQSSISAGTVSKITPNGQVSLFATNGISCNVGVNVDAEGNVYVCNCCSTFGNTIRKVTQQGVSTVFSSSNLFACPNGITRDKEDNLYVSNFGNGSIIKINPQGQASFLAATPGIPGVSLPSNGHIIYSEKEDVLYVASHGSHNIYRLTLGGSLTLLAGSSTRGNTDGAATEASFSRPNGLALSVTEDTLFVNSSIPVTDAGIRPLNPSVIRMLTGLRGMSHVSNTHGPSRQLKARYELLSQQIFIEGLPPGAQHVLLTNMEGQQIYSQELPHPDLRNVSITIDQIPASGYYIITALTESGAMQSTLFAIVDN